MIWIFLSPTSSEDPDKAHYRSTLERIRNALRMLENVLAVLHLTNVSPTALPRGYSSVTARSSQDSLLVHARHEDTGTTLLEVNGLLEKANSTSATEGLLRWSIKAYELTQVFEPRTSKGYNGSCMVTVSIEPGDSQSSDIDRWYRKEQLPMLGETSPALFLRCRRYRHIAETSVDRGGPTTDLLAVHEYRSVKALFQHSLDKGPVLEETEWSKKVLGNAKRVERTIWEVK